MQKVFQPALLNSLQKYNNALAIHQGTQTLTFENLEERAGVIKNFILTQGSIGKNEAIGILAENRADLISAIVGVSLAANVFVPVESSLPNERILKMIAIADIRLLIYQGVDEKFRQLQQALADTPVILVKLDDLTADATLFITGRKPQYLADDPLYIYFTSGSTGDPKAILGKNASLTHFIEWEIAEFAIKPGSRFSQLVNPGFDAFLRDIFVPLFSGAVIVIPTAASLSFETMAKWLVREHINYIHCVPSVFRFINANELNADATKVLRTIFLSGEQIRTSELGRWFDIMGSGVSIYNFYGTTETTMIRTFYQVQPEDVNQARIPAGRAISDTLIYVLDAEKQPCSELEEGDIYLSSPFFSLGYINGGSINRGIFSTDHLSGLPGYELYATGDKGMVMKDGTLNVLGRADGQLKIMGVRIEPGEIENQLLALDGVNDVAVYASHVNDQPVLTCAIVTSNRDELSLKNYLVGKLPAYLIPGKWVFLNELPRLANGKLDRPAILQSSAAPAEKTEVFNNQVEAEIFRIWSGIMKNDRLRTCQTFFEAGGNSFHLISLIAKVHQQYNIRLSIKDIFQCNTIEKLAVFINEQKNDGGQTIPKAPEKEFYNLSSGQFQVFHQQLLYPKSTAYNLPQFFIIEGEVDPHSVYNSIKQLIQNHPTLRTGYTISGEKPVQYITNEVHPEFGFIDKEGMSQADELGLVKDFVRVFDLNGPPLFRAMLVKRSAKNFLLMTDVHHIAADGLSQLILNRDLAALYSGKKLEPAKLQYVDYAEWQYAERQSARYQAQETYWMKKLNPMPQKVILPVNDLAFTPEDQAGAQFIFVVDSEKLSQIKRQIKAADTTIFTYLMAVYNILLNKIGMQQDIAVGTAVDGKNFPGSQNMVGMFVNTLVIRNEVLPNVSFMEFLSNVRTVVMEALANQTVPYADVVNKLKTIQPVTRALFNVMFNYLNMEVEIDNFDAHGVHLYPYQPRTSKFDMSWTGFETNNEIKIRIEYATGLFFEAQIKKISDYFLEILKQVIDNPAISIVEIVLPHNKEAVSYESKNYKFNF